jgi:hypothetical protein
MLIATVSYFSDTVTGAAWGSSARGPGAVEAAGAFAAAIVAAVRTRPTQDGEYSTA